MSTKTQKKTVQAPSTKEPHTEKPIKNTEPSREDSGSKEKPLKKKIPTAQDSDQKPKKTRTTKATPPTHDDNQARDSIPPNERDTVDSRKKKVPNLNRKAVGNFIGDDKPKQPTKKTLDIPEDRKDISDSHDLSDDFEREKPSQLDGENLSPQSDRNEAFKAATQSQQTLDENKSVTSKKGVDNKGKPPKNEKIEIPKPDPIQTGLPVENRMSKLPSKGEEKIETPKNQAQISPMNVEGRSSKIPQAGDQRPLSQTQQLPPSENNARASKFFGNTQPVEHNILNESPEILERPQPTENISPRVMELPSIAESQRVISSPRIKGGLSPKYAHSLTHGKAMMMRSFEKVVSEGGDTKNSEFVSDKHFYYDVLKELEQIPMHLENDDQVEKILTKADKEDQIAFQIVEKKFEKSYALALYHIFFKHATDNDNVRVKLTLGKLYGFMRDFDLYNEHIDKERASLLFSKRCPSKLCDFAGFVDILYKFSKYDLSVSGHSEADHTKRFKNYLNAKIINKHNQIVENAVARHPRVAVFGDEYGLENEPLRIFEGHDNFLKHLFTLYESFDIQYCDRSVVHLKDFKRFCFDYCLIPVLASVHEVVELFRRFQIDNRSVADFRGFVMILGFIANIGFDKGNLKGKYDSYSKKLLKFFDLLLEINQRISDELVLKHMIKCKD